MYFIKNNNLCINIIIKTFYEFLLIKLINHYQNFSKHRQKLIPLIFLPKLFYSITKTSID